MCNVVLGSLREMFHLPRALFSPLDLYPRKNFTITLVDDAKTSLQRFVGVLDFYHIYRSTKVVYIAH